MTEIAEPYLATTLLNLDADKTVTATFTDSPPTTYDLTMAVVGQGTVVPSEGTHTLLAGTMTISATPDAGWFFAGWSTADMTEIAEPYLATTLLNLDADKTVTATFSGVVNGGYDGDSGTLPGDDATESGR
jgi:hypothetical protein